MQITNLRSAAFDGPCAKLSSAHSADADAIPPSDKTGPVAPPDTRCSYFFPSGRRCRQAVCLAHPHFCHTHIPKPSPTPSPDHALAAELNEAAGELSTPDDVRHVMLKVLRGMVHRTIPAKEAGVICYIAQIVLHCQRNAAYCHKLEDDTAAIEREPRCRTYIHDLPMAIRD